MNICWPYYTRYLRQECSLFQGLYLLIPSGKDTVFWQTQAPDIKRFESPETPEEEDINLNIYHERDYTFKMMESKCVTTCYMLEHVAATIWISFGYSISRKYWWHGHYCCLLWWTKNESFVSVDLFRNSKLAGCICEMKFCEQKMLSLHYQFFNCD